METEHFKYDISSDCENILKKVDNFIIAYITVI